jgi:hypothetical protein
MSNGNGSSECMLHPRVVGGGEGLQTWTVAAKILNKQLQTANREQSCSLEAGQRANNLSLYKKACY